MTERAFGVQKLGGDVVTDWAGTAFTGTVEQLRRKLETITPSLLPGWRWR